MLPEQRRINFTRRNFLELVAHAPLALMPSDPEDPWGKEKEPATRPTLALYIPFHHLPNEKRLKPFKKLLLESGANTVVVDIKDEYGYINLPVEHELLPKIAILPGYIEALEDMVLWADRNDIAVIGRQVVMLDTALVTAHRSLGLKRSGGLWQDSFGNYWANPYDERVVLYNAAVTKTAAAFGIRKIQRDYIRFPAGNETKTIIYSKRNTLENRVAAITAFLKASFPLVRRYGTILTADFFGYTAWKEQGDMGIGQLIESAGRYLHGLSPMAYPGLYGSGISDKCPDNCKPPTAHPYEIVYNTVAHTLERLQAVNPDGFVEPWIQAYPDVRFKQPMGLRQFQAQWQAAFDAGATGVMAWDPNLKYHPNFYRFGT